MFKKIIFLPTTWWAIIMAIHVTVDSCKGCNQNKEKTPPPESSSDTTPITPLTTPTGEVPTKTKLDEATDSPNAEDRGSSSSPSISSSSGISSADSVSFTPVPSAPPAPTAFAGLPNVGNSCYMNAVLQVIAALYKDEVKHRCLEQLISQINTKDQALNASDIKEFIQGLPEAAKKMAESKQQQDPDEFIECIKEKFLYAGNVIIYPIRCTESLYFKIKSNSVGNSAGGECFYKYSREGVDAHVLSIPITGPTSNLSAMIQSYQEQCVQQEQGIHIAWNNTASCKEENLPAFVKNKRTCVNFIVDKSETASAKDYIKQIVFQLPDLLYIKLNRMDGSSNKITHPVSGTFNITIHPDPNQEYAVSFDLHAFIVHDGPDAKYGHYIAYVKREGKWYEANDATITEVTLSKAIARSKKAYLLFYKKG